MKNQKKLFTRAGKPRNQWKKVIKLWGQKLWSRFFIGSGIFHRSWTVFSDSPYQKLPPTPFHIASSRCYVPFPYFHVSHAKCTVLIRLFETFISKKLSVLTVHFCQSKLVESALSSPLVKNDHPMTISSPIFNNGPSTFTRIKFNLVANDHPFWLKTA